MSVLLFKSRCVCELKNGYQLLPQILSPVLVNSGDQTIKFRVTIHTFKDSNRRNNEILSSFGTRNCETTCENSESRPAISHKIDNLI